MTQQVKKSATQIAISTVYEEIKNAFDNNPTLSATKFGGVVMEAVSLAKKNIPNDETGKKIKKTLTLVIKEIHQVAKQVAGSEKLISSDDFWLTHFGGIPKDITGLENTSFDIIYERAPNDNVIVIFGQSYNTSLSSSEIISEAEHTFGIDCSEIILWHSIGNDSDALLTPYPLFEDDQRDHSTGMEIGRVEFDKKKKCKLNMDKQKNELWGRIRPKFASTVNPSIFVTLTPPPGAEGQQPIVIAQVGQVLTHQQHTATGFQSFSDLSTEVKLIPLHEKVGDRLQPITNKKFQGYKIRFLTEEERYILNGMKPNSGIPCGMFVMENGKEIPASLPYDPSDSALNKTPYLSNLYFGIQNGGKTNTLNFSIRAVTTANRIPDNKKPAIIIIDGEDSFLNFPTISQMVPETQKYMRDNGLGDIDHQVFTLSNIRNVGNATLSFDRLEPDVWHNMLPSLTAKTEGQLITILRMTFNMLERDGRELTTDNIRATALALAQRSNIIHQSQIPAIARALEAPELDMFSDDQQQTVLNPQVLFQPGKVTTINVNGLDMNRRRIVTLYILELLHRFKVLNKINEPGVIVAIDEVEFLFPKKPTSREKDFVDRISERTATIVELGRKRFYGIYLVTHSTDDASSQVVKLVGNHFAHQCSGSENQHISKYIGPEFVHEINNLEIGHCRVKTNTRKPGQAGVNALIKLPFVGFASELGTTGDALDGAEDDFKEGEPLS